MLVAAADWARLANPDVAVALPGLRAPALWIAEALLAVKADTDDSTGRARRLVKYAKVSAEALGRWQAETDPAARRRSR
ncbi:hypothetical protein ACIRRA_18555 [Nocardia sp. NPDC101769]|uniref:hypothetical protein n=1 Tax=Nocardia sp. NPDC101769 TaxID=3364333 RepID=UPI003822F809